MLSLFVDLCFLGVLEEAGGGAQAFVALQGLEIGAFEVGLEGV